MTDMDYRQRIKEMSGFDVDEVEHPVGILAVNTEPTQVGLERCVFYAYETADGKRKAVVIPLSYLRSFPADWR